MKKLCSTFLVFALVTVYCQTAFAADKTTTVYTDVPAAYIITIPPRMEIPYNSQTGQKLTLSVSDCTLEGGKTIKISATGSGQDGAFVMMNDQKSLAYEISQSNTAWSAIAPAAQVAEFTSDGNKDIFVKVSDWSATQAGRYSGTVTFTIRYD